MTWHAGSDTVSHFSGFNKFPLDPRSWKFSLTCRSLAPPHVASTMGRNARGSGTTAAGGLERALIGTASPRGENSDVEYPTAARTDGTVGRGQGTGPGDFGRGALSRCPGIARRGDAVHRGRGAVGDLCCREEDALRAGTRGTRGALSRGAKSRGGRHGRGLPGPRRGTATGGGAEVHEGRAAIQRRPSPAISVGSGDHRPAAAPRRRARTRSRAQRQAVVSTSDMPCPATAMQTSVRSVRPFC